MTRFRLRIERTIERVKAFTEALKREQEERERGSGSGRECPSDPADPSDPRGYCTGPGWSLDELRRRINEDEADEG